MLLTPLEKRRGLSFENNGYSLNQECLKLCYVWLKLVRWCSGEYQKRKSRQLRSEQKQ